MSYPLLANFYLSMSRRKLFDELHRISSGNGLIFTIRPVRSRLSSTVSFIRLLFYWAFSAKIPR
jgi:hypothetical protein